MENNISLLVGLKNNLDYSKHFYETTRKLYPEVEICFVSYGSTDGTDQWLDSIESSNTVVYHSSESKTFSDTFNKAMQIATKEYVAYLHNDIVLAPNFLENISKHLQPDTVVSYTTIEPPIFAGHERPGKIIQDFGIDIKTYRHAELVTFCSRKQEEFRDKVEPGVVFFLCTSRELLLQMGGMDNLFAPMFCEDDDLIRRFGLKGVQMITSLDALCYHFVSKTSRFSEEYQNKTQQIEANSNKNYIRKWGSRDAVVRYNIGYVVDNCNLEMLNILEPLCDNIYILNSDVRDNYCNYEQPNTKFNLKERIRTSTFKDLDTPNNIVVKFDATKLTNSNYQLLTQLPQIVQETNELGQFELDIFTITIKDLTQYQNNLIHIYNR